MAGNSVGQIALDLTVNRNGFDRSMKGITGLAKKAGLALAAAFGIRKLINFGKECLELGSNLQEVQNVVDVTFPNMSAQIDAFAKNAAGQFGLSETMAKKFSGTFGAMAKAFGFSEKEAYKMSTALTGLAGDVASFYNLSQDAAYTKLKSVFSGETETLKDLGIVMTQNALDAYALAKGYGKVTSKMTEAEKVSLRFAFVQEQLSGATGDFARTSNSWANQTKVLSLQFDSLKASIGQGLINVFTPVIRAVNTLLAKLQILGDAFKNLTTKVFGDAGSSNAGATATADAMDTASDASDTVAGNTEKAAKAAKKLKASVMGFDSLNKLSSNDTSGSDSSGGSTSVGSIGNLDIATEVDTKEIEKATTRIEMLKNAFLTLKNSFLNGFKIGIGDISVLERIKGNLASIKETFMGIAHDKKVQKSLENLFFTMVESAGKVAGSLASISFSITELLTGGLSKYLEKDSGRIKEYIVSMFDCGTEISQLSASFAETVSDIFNVFRSDKAQQIVADCIKVFSDAYMGVTELKAKWSTDLIGMYTQPFNDNKDGIKDALASILNPIQTVTSSISGFVENTFDRLFETYDKYVSPAFENIKEGFSTIFSACLEGYKQYLEPVINKISERFSALVEQYLNPLMETVMEYAGKLTEAVSMLFKFLAPFIGWFAKNFIAVIATKIQWLWTIVESGIAFITTILKGLYGILGGLIDFLVGVFTGDWQKAWDGVKEIVGSVWDMIRSLIKNAVNKIKNVIDVALTKIKNIAKSALDLLKTIFGKRIGKIKETCVVFGNFLKKTFKTDFMKAFTAIQKVLSDFKKGAVDICSSVKKVFKGITTFVLGTFTTNWKKAWTGVKKILKSVFKGLASVVKGPLNLIIGMINRMLSGVFKGLNWLISKVNTFNIDVPKWVPKIGGKKWGFNMPSIGTGGMKIPFLANGAYVKANTPQLAMIGDNRHQGEVVAPEDKLQSMVDTAVRQNTDYIVSALKQIFQGQNQGGNIELSVNIGSKKVMNEVLKAANNGNKRMGKTVYNV